MRFQRKPPGRLTVKLIHLLYTLLLLAPGSVMPHSARAQPNWVEPATRPVLATAAPPTPQITSSGAVGQPASFVLGQPLRAVQAAVAQSPNDWTPDYTDDFEVGLSQQWQVFDNSEDGVNRQWGIDDFYAASGSQSLWVAAGGSDGLDPENFYYPGDLDTWIVSSNFFDLSQAQMADVEFAMRYDTEPEVDYVFVGASVDGETFYGEYYSGDSGGWDSFNLDLSEYVGYPQVYIGWYFYSDAGEHEHEGVWLDDITVWTYTETGPPQGNEAVQNGDFETGDLSGWTVPSGSTVVATDAPNPVAGSYVAYFGGVENAEEAFYQPLTVPDNDVSSATVGFWVNTFGPETQADADYFCAGLLDALLNQILVDFGCLDGVEATTADFALEGWRQVNNTLSADQWNAIRGQTVNLAFQMFTDDELHTTVFIDDVTFEIVTGGSTGDGHEPNNTLDQATAITPGAPITDLTIDGDQDADVFRVSAGAAGTLVVDIDAASNGSPLDAVATVLNAAGEQLCQNDDDGVTTDPYVTCELPAAGDYYVVVSSYDGSGDRNFTYTITVQLTTDGAPPPTPTPPAPTPTPPPNPNGQRAWTAIVYIDADNNLCDSYPPLITRMERELGAKIGANGFLNIAVLIDLNPQYCQGSGQAGATRYLIQPNGQYTDNVNRWNMGELNMGDPQTLINFANWAMQNYPADHYYLAIDNHGGGVSGISWDDTNNHDNISNDELFSALKEITQNGARKIAVFAYEACLMAMYENVYDLRNFTELIFGFPTISFTNNASYPSYLGDARFTAQTTSRELGEIMFDVYYNAVTQPYVVSLVDSTQVDALHGAVNTWATALANAVSGSASALAAGRNAAQKVEANGDNVITNDDEFVDLWDLADKLAAQGLAATEAAALKSALEAAVVRVSIRPAAGQIPWDYSHAHGLTIFWPQTPNGYYSDYVGNRIYNSTRDGQWDEFLTAFFGALPNGRGRGSLAATTGAIDRLDADSFNTFDESLFLPVVQK